MMLKKQLAGLVCAALTTLWCYGITTPTNKHRKITPPPYRPYQHILPILRQNVSIPVLLPTPNAVENHIFHRTLSKDNIFLAQKNNYIVFYEWFPTCHGAPICTVAAVYAAKIGKKMPYNPTVVSTTISSQTHDQVKLAQGIIGNMEKNHAGNTVKSHLHTLTWQQNGVRYQLTLNENNTADFITIANSAINHGAWNQPTSLSGTDNTPRPQNT